jgi:serine/threonine protein kinase
MQACIRGAKAKTAIFAGACLASLLAAEWAKEGFPFASFVAVVCVAGGLCPLMAEVQVELTQGRHTGLRLELAGVGELQLTEILITNAETEIYYTSHPGVLVKMFDLDCGKADEISYGPYLGFTAEVENFEDIRGIDELQAHVPTFYGAGVDYERKYAFIAMEYLEGDHLESWCAQASRGIHSSEWVDELRQAIYEALNILGLFHKHGIILTDFKPHNILRLNDKRIKFVDLGALCTPRHGRDSHTYTYAATPDHAEVLIDASNVQTGLPPSEATDIFAAGVALFEMATGRSRLAIGDATAEEILSQPAVFRFRDTQIKDVWKAYPHLKELLPLLQTQLEERQILFADLWPLLKGYLASKLSEWDALPPEQQGQIILAAGTTFIMEQLPSHLQWLAGPIARATVLRSMRLKDIGTLMRLIGKPVSEYVRDDLLQRNDLVQYLRDVQGTLDFVERLNTWEVSLHPKTGHWTILASVASAHLGDSAQFTFLKQGFATPQGDRFYQIVGDLEADDFDGGKLSCWHLRDDHFAWIG